MKIKTRIDFFDLKDVCKVNCSGAESSDARAESVAGVPARDRQRAGLFRHESVPDAYWPHSAPVPRAPDQRPPVERPPDGHLQPSSRADRPVQKDRKIISA